MSEPATGSIEIYGLGKEYPIYRSPSHRLLELLALGRVKMHGGHWALRHVDLQVEPGTTLGIVGQNGSGKSTLLQIVAGIFKPSEGVCQVTGTVAALLELGAGFNPEFTGRENVYMNAAIQGLTRRQVDGRMDEILAFAEIGDFINRPVKTYSSGMFLRLAFSAAIHVDPDILLVDEALAVGDLIFQHRCINRIRQMREEGKTILFVSHDLAAITKFCDRAVLIDRSRKLMDSKPEDVVHRYQELIFQRERRMAGRGEDFINVDQDASLPLVDTIPHIHNRYGEGGAEITGVLLHSPDGKVLNSLSAGDDAVLLVSVRWRKSCQNPIVGFTVRDHHGVEICSSNTSYEELHLPPLKAGEVITVGFHIHLPTLRPGSYSISPAAAAGNIWEHTIEDRIENAYIFNLLDTGLVYGMMRWPVEVTFRSHNGASLKEERR
ncbi:MAG TPA: ABC transporter ATP-binding protein [Acidobacteriota bacterium]|nr:ABC transporter ATP-binding protein [Acidobacteriota bacterium]